MKVIKKAITYFDGEGQKNIPKTIEAVSRFFEENTGIKKVVVFTANGEGAIALSTALKNRDIKIIAVTFPFGQTYKTSKGDGQVVVGIVDPSTREELERSNIKIVQGSLPFQDIIIPHAADPKLQSIIYTLRLFGGGTELCVQATIMACEAGTVAPGEDVVVMSADTALVVTAARKLTLFSPFEGLEIKEIICKPSRLTITRRRKDSMEPEADE